MVLTCRDTLGSVTVDNLGVPSNGRCTLNGTRIQGTLKVESNATLVGKGIRVIGNIQAENARTVNVLENSIVGGSIQSKQGSSARIETVRINGDLQFGENRHALRAVRNTIGGSIIY